MNRMETNAEFELKICIREVASTEKYHNSTKQAYKIRCKNIHALNTA